MSWTSQTDELPVFCIVHIKEETVTEYSLVYQTCENTHLDKLLKDCLNITEKLEVDESDAPQRNLQSGAHVDVL